MGNRRSKFAGNSPVAPVRSGFSEDNTVARLKGLKELLDGGVLTQEEFDAQKKEILEKPKTTQV